MKRSFSTTLWLIVILFLALLLVACERPLQEEDTGTSAAPDLTQPTTMPGGTSTPLAAPTTGDAYPGPDESGYPAPGAGEEPAEGGELPSEPAPTASPGAAEQPQEDVVHSVVAGETLGTIAQQYGVTVEEIAAANDLANIHTLDVGQQLLIPLGGGGDAAETPPDSSGEGEPEEQVHIVQAGDNLYRLGLRYGFTIEELAAYNNLANPNSLEIGQRILIPPEGYTAP